MSIRSKAFFDGLEVQVSCSMSRSNGTTPDIGELVWQIGTPQPSAFIGNLVLYNGTDAVLTFHDCLLTKPTLKRSGTKYVTYKIKDRRWRWATPSVFGQYNVRDEKALLVEETKKTPRELASLLLDAMGETGYDVSALSTDVELAPSVFWHYTHAASELEKLCAMQGCSITLLNDNTVKIVIDNVGAIPDNTGLMYEPDVGLIVNVAPDYISGYAGDTQFESWLTLEAIGKDVGGEYKPIGMLSYRPEYKWVDDPSTGYNQIRDELRGSTPEEDIDKIVGLANSTVYKLFRVIGFPGGQKFFPGFTFYELDYFDDLPEEEPDESLVYLIKGNHTVVWSEGSYYGITWHNDSDTDYCLVDVEMIRDLKDPLIDSGTLEEMLDAQVTNDIARYVVLPPLNTAIDPRLIIPLLPSRVQNALDENQQNTKQAAEICGKFVEEDEYKRNVTNREIAIWKNGFSIDQQRGHVTLGSPGYRWSSSGLQPPELYLRCGYGYRLFPYGSRYHRRVTLPTGNNIALANGVVNRSDIVEFRVQDYLSDYNDLTEIGASISNTSIVDTILTSAINENMRQYQNHAAPQQKQYTPFRAIDTNGIVQQVSYSCGHKKLGMTEVSIGESFNSVIPPAKLKRLHDLQKREAEKSLQDFKAAAIGVGIGTKFDFTTSIGKDFA